MTYPEEE